MAGCNLDVHLRPDDEVHVYCGLTRLVVISRKANGDIEVKAASSYLVQDCSRGLFGTWRVDEIDERVFDRRLTAYLDGVKVSGRWVRREGTVQTGWSLVRDPWVPFDREAVLGYPSSPERDRARCFEDVVQVRERVEALRKSHGWATLPGRGGEVDQLAVDPDGRLVVIELKDASAAGVYYAPLQLLQYVWEWHSGFEMVRDGVQKLLDARVTLGLTPPDVSRVGDHIRPVVGFGDDCRSKEVKRRYAKVLKIANAHLPQGVANMETWTLNPLRRID